MEKATLRQYARDLRRNSTDTEKHLWYYAERISDGTGSSQHYTDEAIIHVSRLQHALVTGGRCSGDRHVDAGFESVA
jgi:very-short-patch-repair endonuclease